MQHAAIAEDELQDDALTGRVRVYQRRHGHRYSLDDVLTARVALQARPTASTGLDLGCGLGSVLLMLADKLPDAQLLGLEAQEVSYQLAVRNIERNGFAGRVRAEPGDLRDEAQLAALRAQLPAGISSFELVTGTPPYMPLGTGTPSPDSQRAHARVELRGGVEAYLLAASRVLASEGVCVVCAGAGAEARVQDGAARAGLVPIARLDAVAMRGRTAGLFAVHTLVRDTSLQVTSAPLVTTFVARDEHGARTAQAVELRRFFDLDSSPSEAPSPRLRERRGFSSDQES